MKSVFAVSLVSAVLSLAAVLGFSAMTFFPGLGAERFRAAAMTLAAVFIVAWLGVAFRARARQRVEASVPVAPWLRRVLLLVGIFYSLGIILLVFG